jgi:hypothetical protein
MEGDDRMSGSTIDWEAIRRRIASAEKQLHETFAGRGSWATTLLRRRRDQLALGQAGERTGELVLRVRGRALAYGLPASEVAEIAPLPGIAAVPGECPEFLGLIGLRGHVLRLFDLDLLTGTTAQPAEGGFAVRLRGMDAALRVMAVDTVELMDDTRPLAAGEDFELVRAVSTDWTLLLDCGALRRRIKGGEGA